MPDTSRERYAPLDSDDFAVIEDSAAESPASASSTNPASTNPER